MMLTKRVFVSIPLFLSLLPSFGLSEPANPALQEREAVPDVEAFQQLLDQAEPASLHAMLHDYSPKKFKHGMFREDRSAVQAIHRDNPPLAASIVSLAKRQGSNNGTSLTPTPAVVPSPTTSFVDSLNPSASNPNQISNTERVTPFPQGGTETSTVVTATTLASDSSSPASTTVSASSQQPTITDASSAPSAQQSSISTAAETSSPSAGSVFTTTNSFGVIIVTTVGGSFKTVGSVSPSTSATQAETTVPSNVPAKSTLPSRTSAIVRTSTLPNGSKSVVTATTVVGGGEVEGSTPTGSAGVDKSATGTGKPSLQTNLGSKSGSTLKEMLCALGGAVWIAILM